MSVRRVARSTDYAWRSCRHVMARAWPACGAAHTGYSRRRSRSPVPTPDRDRRCEVCEEVRFALSQLQWIARTHCQGVMMWRTNFIGVVAALLAAAPVLAQTGTITGTVTSAADGRPISDARIRVGSSTIGTLTRSDGHYSVTVAAGTYTVRVARLGFAVDSAPNVVVSAGSSATANFQLRQSAALLGEVTVTVPYAGEQSGREQTGAVASVTPREFNT